MSITTVLEVSGGRAVFRQQNEERAILLASSLAEIVADPLYIGNLDMIRDIAEITLHQDGLTYFQVFNSFGQLIVDPEHSGYTVRVVENGVAHQALYEGATATRYVGDAVEVAIPIHAGRQLLGAVEIGLDDEHLRANISTLTSRRMWQSAFLMLAGIALAFIRRGDCRGLSATSPPPPRPSLLAIWPPGRAWRVRAR